MTGFLCKHIENKIFGGFGNDDDKYVSNMLDRCRMSEVGIQWSEVRCLMWNVRC